MQPITIAAVVLLTITACGKKSDPIKIPPLPKIEVNDVPAPASATVIVERDSNLRAIAAVAYGHEDFSGFVAQLNGITAPERLMAGITLKTPSIPIVFRDAGIDVKYQPSINALAKAWTDLVIILPDYIKARDFSGAPDGKLFAIPPDVRTKLINCADAIDASIHALNHPAVGHSAPVKTIDQFARVSSSIRRLATGFVESHDYDAFLIEKGFGLGFTYALIWTQAHHK